MITSIQPDYMEHANTLLSGSIIVIGTLLSVIGIFLGWAIRQNTQTLSNFRDDIKALFRRTEVNEKEIAYLKGAHEARTNMKLSCLSEK